MWYLEFGRYCRFLFTSNHAGRRLSGQCCIVALCSFLCCRCLGFHASVLWHAHERPQIHFRMQGRPRISVLCRKIFHSRYMCGMSDFQVSLGKKCHALLSLLWFWHLLLLKISLNEHHAIFVKFFEALLCLCFLKTRGSTLDLKSEQKGLLWILDEESIFPGANDSSFLARLYVHHCNDSKFIFLQPFISSKRIAWALTAGSCFL